MKNGPIISAILGAGFVAVPMVIGVSTPISLGIGAVAFVAGNLIFSDKEKEVTLNSSENLYDTLNSAKKTNSEICSMVSKIEDPGLQEDIREIYRIANKIIDTISKNPSKQKQASNFFHYYLPVTLKILKRYDEIENQRLVSDEGKNFMKNTREMVATIKKSFQEQLSNLYQADMMDTDADMKVFKSMLKTDGYTEIDDFKIDKESKS
jgi:5-bromo-4-chloroindolyl phosphate hydrolysis protein